MDKNAYLQEIYNQAFNDELEKTAGIMGAAKNFFTNTTLGKMMGTKALVEGAPQFAAAGASVIGSGANIITSLLNRIPTKSTVVKKHLLGLDPKFGKSFKHMPYALSDIVTAASKKANTIGKKGIGGYFAKRDAKKAVNKALHSASKASPAMTVTGLSLAGIGAIGGNKKTKSYHTSIRHPVTIVQDKAK